MEMDAVKGVCYQMLPSWKRELCKYLKMVDLVGIEPTTSSMPWKRAPSCATGPRLETRRIGIEGSAESFSPTSLG